MRVFKEPNLSDKWKCPICKTNKKEEVVLIPIVGTKEGNTVQAEQFHLSCINLMWDKSFNILYQKIGRSK